ncbi:MAG: N-acetyltransferase [Chloroflexi bacterium]|nr:N-acetyltransferase [Chloroflexota bacterium]
MDKAELLALFDKEQRIEIEHPGMRRDMLPHVIRHAGVDRDGWAGVLYSHLNRDNVDDAIREQITYFENIGRNFEWKVYDRDTPEDLKERLKTYGFEPEGPEALMVLDMTEMPQMLQQPITHDIRRITDPARIGDVVTVEKQVWQKDEDRLGRRLQAELQQHPESLSVYVAYVDGKPASAAWINFHEQSQFASLWGGSTIAAYRKRGLYTALLAVRAKEALSRGARFLTVDASPMSRPILEKHGFKLLTFTHPYNWHVKAAEQKSTE